MTSTSQEAPSGLAEAEGPERPSKFRFKSKSSHHRRRDRSRERSRSPRRESERHSHRHHHRSKRRRHSPEAEGHNPDDSTSQGLDPDVAFRESLFDAMADDEGAQYWEGVYGQPIHTYPNVKEGPQGELERMTDEEYTAFVRAKMYEKTHQHLIEEKARREAARKERAARAEEGARAEREAERFKRRLDESLRRGEERKSRKAWGQRWESYLEKWQALGAQGSTSTVHLASIPWPVESGRRADVNKGEVERFLIYAPTSGQPTETQLSKILKLERVRWHPDKIQQKLGGQDVAEEVIQGVTAVFQIIDELWAKVRRDET